MNNFKFRYDLHVHTKETSRCGRVGAAELVKYYKHLGYSGFALSDHYNDRLRQMLVTEGSEVCQRNLMDRLLLGYRAAQKTARELDFEVLLGCELRFEENGNDYLIFGMDEDFFYSSGNLRLLGIREFYKKYAERLVIIQAHPYRDGNEIVPIEYVHGLETLNLNARHENRNQKAHELAKKNSLFEICGSDAHRLEDIGLGNVCFNERVTDSAQLASLLKSRNFFSGASAENFE